MRERVPQRHYYLFQNDRSLATVNGNMADHHTFGLDGPIGEVASVVVRWFRDLDHSHVENQRLNAFCNTVNVLMSGPPNLKFIRSWSLH